MRSESLQGATSLAVLCIGLVIGLSACDGRAVVGTGDSAELAGSAWTLSEVRLPDGKVLSRKDILSRTYTPAERSEGLYTLTFTGDGKVSGRAACNGYGGVYTAGSSGSVAIDSVVSTLIGCRSIESLYFELLGTASTFRAADRSLRLNGSEGSLLFVRRPNPEK